MTDEEALRFLDAAEQVFAAGEAELTALERETQNAIDEIHTACVAADVGQTQVIDALKASRSQIAGLRGNANKAFVTCIADVGKLALAAVALGSDIEETIETGRTLEDLPEEFAAAAEAGFEELKSSLEEAQGQAQSLAQESMAEVNDALEKFQSQWLEIAGELKETAASTVEEVQSEIVEAFVERATAELNEKTGGVLDALTEVNGALEDIRRTLQSSFGGVADAMQSIEKVVGPVRPVFEAMSAVG